MRSHLVSVLNESEWCFNLTITGGNITLKDLEGYYSEMEEPLEFRLNNGNFTLLSPQPPSGGIVVGHILKILDGESGVPINLRSWSHSTWCIRVFHLRSILSNPLFNKFSEIQWQKYGAWIVHQIKYTSTFPLCKLALLHSFVGYNFNSDSDSNTEKATLFYHRLVEAFKFAYARRSELGDNANETVSVLKANTFLNIAGNCR